MLRCHERQAANKTLPVVTLPLPTPPGIATSRTASMDTSTATDPPCAARSSLQPEPRAGLSKPVVGLAPIWAP